MVEKWEKWKCEYWGGGGGEHIYIYGTPPPKDLGIFMVLGSVLGFKGWGWGAS